MFQGPKRNWYWFFAIAYWARIPPRWPAGKRKKIDSELPQLLVGPPRRGGQTRAVSANLTEAILDSPLPRAAILCPVARQTGFRSQTGPQRVLRLAYPSGPSKPREAHVP